MIVPMGAVEQLRNAHLHHIQYHYDTAHGGSRTVEERSVT